VNDPKLGTQHRARAAGVDGAQRVLPEAASHGEDRVVVDPESAITAAVRDRRRRELALDLSSEGFERFA
jgi:hypothetical protein